MKFSKILLVATAMTFASSTFAAAPLTKAQFHAMLVNDASYKALLTNVVALKVALTVATNRLAQDEKTISRMIPYAPVTWYQLPECQGSPMQLQDDGGYDDKTLQGGIVFRSGIDGTVWWLPPISTLTQQHGAWSHFSNGICTTEQESVTGYFAQTIT